MKYGIKILLAGLMMVSLAFAAEAEKNRLVARRDFEASPLWQPKVFMGRDFWNIMAGTRFRPNRKKYGNCLYFPISLLPENMRKHLDIPAFTEVAIKTPPLACGNVRKNPDGTITLVPPDNYKEWVPADRPFIISDHRFLRGMYYPELRWRFDYQPYPEYWAWEKRYQNFWYVSGLLEWGNNMNTLYLHLARWMAQGKVTPAQLEKIKARFMENPPTRRDYVNFRLKPDFEHAVKVWQDDTSVQDAFDGAFNIAHLAAYWGAGMITMESCRSFVNWQYQMMFHRGAARQFDIPWCWYAAAHITIRDAKGRSMGKGGEPCAWKKAEHFGPACGASMNSRERVSYMAYLSGANAYQRETACHNYWDATAIGDDRWKPATEGRMYIDFFNFTKRNPKRGIPYTPIALLVAYDRGTSRIPGKAFWRYRYLQSDNMLDAFVTTIFPPVSAWKMHRRGIEITLMNSKYGDIFDAITPDFEKSEAFARILPAYKAAILIGDYEENPGMVKAMVNYVRGGGTLILNAKQLHLKFSDGFTGVKTDGEFMEDGYKVTLLKPDGAAVLLADKQNRPVFTRNSYGKGAVIVGSPNFLTPLYNDGNEKIANEALRATVSGQRKFPYVAWLLDHLLDEVIPAKVSGDIQYGFNRTPTGWWIYLFNNKGILKTALTPQKIDPSAKTVVNVDLSGLKASAVKDLVTGETFSGGKLKIPVESGKYRILDIQVP